MILKFPWQCKGSRVANTTRRTKIGRLTLPVFSTYYEPVLIKAAWHWCEDTQIGQQNKMKSPEVESYVCM